MRLLSPLILCLLILALTPLDLFAQTSVNLNPEGTLTCELGTEQNELSATEAAGLPDSFAPAIKALKKRLRKGKRKVTALRTKLRKATGKKKKKNIKMKIANAKSAKKQNQISLAAVKDCQNQTLVPHPELCGNNLIEPFEDCDNGNLNDNDCCSSTCLFEGTETDCGEIPAESCGAFRCNGVGSCELTPICSDGDSCTENDFCESDSCQGIPFTSESPTGCGVGACFREVFACNNGSANSCIPGAPGTESCDGADNDCDGATDEGNPGGGSACNSGLPGICQDGTTACESGSIACNPNNTPIAETCNRIDDDCDGATDDGNPGGGSACDSGLLGICQDGTTACESGAIACNPNNTPVAETCNGIDDDCDGATDDGNPGGGSACDSGLLGICQDGTTACESGAIACNPNNTPVAETCNGIDDDCDGATDDGNPGGGSACNSGLPGICQDGTTACESGSIACNPNNTPIAETCNGIDDDCDGAVDNGLAQDNFEPNNSCGTFFSLATLGSDQSFSENSATLYGSGDEDFYRIIGSETDVACGCGPISGDEDYNMKVSLTVPANTGSYQVCSESTSCGTFSNCTTVNAGSSGSIDLFLDGECPGHDEYNVYVRVRGIGTPGFSCFPYVLHATFISGLCR